MRTTSINLIFILHLFSASKRIVTGMSRNTQNVQSNYTADRLPFPEHTKVMHLKLPLSEHAKVMHLSSTNTQSIGPNYDHQNIVVMEDNPVVIQSAMFLFKRDPSRSTLLRHHKGALQVLSGSDTPLTIKSLVLLVGHGSKASDGNAKLGGYELEELAKVVAAMPMKNRHLCTLSLVGCELGKDLDFAKQLLQILRVLDVETKLHLSSSKISVSPAGAIMTEHNGVWRCEDRSKKVIAQLDLNGSLLTRVEVGERGRVIPNYQGHALYLEILEWPTRPQMFVPEYLRKMYTSIDCLEGLTWSLFFEEHEKRRAPDYFPAADQRNLKPVWLSTKGPTTQDHPMMKHITTILDLLVEIRYNAREEARFDMYYVLNDCIYKVQRRTFNISLVGKYIDPSRGDDTVKFLATYEEEKTHYSLRALRQGLEASEFNGFCRQTFQLRQCVHECERWGRYFMAAVFTASVHNFRTFSLFLMSVIACEVSKSEGSDTGNPLCTAFVGEDHPMASDNPWPEDGRRGFYGCTAGGSEMEMVKETRRDWLNEVVAKENSLFTSSKKMMSGVDHDQETELDIFGRVKVMNNYAFSAYLEFFRGTPEGKKLKRGCIPEANKES